MGRSPKHVIPTGMRNEWSGGIFWGFRKRKIAPLWSCLPTVEMTYLRTLIDIFTSPLYAEKSATLLYQFLFAIISAVVME